MRISDINKKYKNIIHEKEFDSLGILDSKTNLSICSFLDDEKYLDKLKDNVTMLITNQSIYEKLKDKNIGFLIVDNPRITFFELHNNLISNNQYIRIKFKTTIGKNCNISPLAYIAPYNVKIGDNVTIEEFASIKENTTIENDCFVGAGTIIGGDGFEYKKNHEQTVKVQHYGGVVIKNNVSIDYNACIDKALYPWDDTIIGEYSRIDNLVHIAHACKIGKRVLITAGSVIAGRVEIGDDSWIGIGAIVRNGLKIGNNARCNMGSVVTKDVMNEQSVTGNFAVDHNKFIEILKKQNKGG